ncbi:unnamed protein product, partial [Tetraodon nigroviridis]
AGYQPPASSQNYHCDPDPEPVRQAAAASPPSSGVSALEPPVQQQDPTLAQTSHPRSPPQKRYRAIYDYAAADDDEVSFVDGDVIVDVHQIDEGWMYGRVERTGQQGMLPANYVDAI